MLRLQELGFTNAYALLGGLAAWQTAKLPTETAPADNDPVPAPAQTPPPTKPN